MKSGEPRRGKREAALDENPVAGHDRTVNDAERAVIDLPDAHDDPDEDDQGNRREHAPARKTRGAGRFSL